MRRVEKRFPIFCSNKAGTLPAPHGAKLLIWHGWTDAIVNPFDTVTYYEKVAAKMGATTPNFVRLFMAPGVDHCGGGPGPGGFDLMTALESWVEKNVAPDRIVASKAGMTRPLCPHPQVAKYNGTGNTNDAASFACVAADASGMP